MKLENWYLFFVDYRVALRWCSGITLKREIRINRIYTDLDFSLKKWSWRDLNPRPNKELICFLHAYLRLSFREWARPKPPTQTLAFLFQIRAKASPILSPICLHHLIGTLRSHSFRVMSCPYTCARIKLESTILRLSSKSVIVIAS